MVLKRKVARAHTPESSHTLLDCVCEARVAPQWRQLIQLINQYMHPSREQLLLAPDAKWWCCWWPPSSSLAVVALSGSGRGSAGTWSPRSLLDGCRFFPVGSVGLLLPLGDVHTTSSTAAAAASRRIRLGEAAIRTAVSQSGKGRFELQGNKHLAAGAENAAWRCLINGSQSDVRQGLFLFACS